MKERSWESSRLTTGRRFSSTSTRYFFCSSRSCFLEVWLAEDGGRSWLQLRELLPVSELSTIFAKDSRVQINARKADAAPYEYQATAVWREGKAPPDYRTKEWYEDLQRVAVCQRQRVPVTEPLTTSSAREAVVQEYLSWEAGLVRLLDQDRGVALFSLENVWVTEGGQGRPLAQLDDRLLQDHLPPGAKVTVVVKPLVAAKHSQLRYQTIILWTGGDRSMPKEFGATFNSRQRRQEMSVGLRAFHESTKAVLRLQRTKSLPPRPDTVLVPVLVNLLPKYASCRVSGYECLENASLGLLTLSLPAQRNEDKNVKVLVLFHLEDVVDSEGNPAFLDPKVTVKSLREHEVELVARSIANGDSSSDITRFISKLEADYPDSQIPLLQAVRVFLKSTDGRIFPGCAPLPTFLRKEPKSFNFQQPATAFYLGLGLKNCLDSKVLEWVDHCPSMVKSALASILNPWFTSSTHKAAIKKEIPRLVLEAQAKLDTLGNSKHKMGDFDPELVTPPIRPPDKVSEVPAKLVLVHHSSQSKPRMGLVEFKLDVRGVKEKCLAFCTLKTVIMEQRSFGDITNLVSVGAGEELVVNAKLMSENSKVPYLATAVWRARDGRPRGEGLNLTSCSDHQKEEWRKNTEAMVTKWTMINGERHEQERKKEQEEVMKRAEAALSKAGGTEEPKKESMGWREEGVRREEVRRAPSPMEEEKAEEERGPWAWQPSLVEWVGTVEKVINNNFALAVSYQRNGPEERRFFIMFDTCDVWQDGEVAQKKGKGMKEITARMDSVKFNAVLVEGTENPWNLIYLATAVIIHKDQEVIRAITMPSRAIQKDSYKELNPVKIKTFEQVAGKLTQKPAPEDLNVVARMEANRLRMAEQDRMRKDKAARLEQSKARYKAESEREDRMAQIKAIEDEKKASVRRKELMSNPDLWAELKGMEILRGAVTMYSCKVGTANS